MTDEDLKQIEELIKKHKPDLDGGLGCILGIVIAIFIILVSCKH